MPNDAKLGLVVGVGVVIAVAVIYFRKNAPPASAEPAAALQSPANRITKGTPTSRPADNAPP